MRLGYNLNGESTLHWTQYHLVEHHANVNNVDIDPEKVSGMFLWAGSYSYRNLMRVNPLDPRHWIHLGQHVYFGLYLVLYGFVNMLASISNRTVCMLIVRF